MAMTKKERRLLLLMARILQILDPGSDLTLDDLITDVRREAQQELDRARKAGK